MTTRDLVDALALVDPAGTTEVLLELHAAWLGTPQATVEDIEGESCVVLSWEGVQKGATHVSQADRVHSGHRHLRAVSGDR